MTDQNENKDDSKGIWIIWDILQVAGYALSLYGTYLIIKHVWRMFF